MSLSCHDFGQNKNPLENDVWQLCLKLREVVELICAPKIHENQVTYLQIEAYFEMRMKNFPGNSLQPKHHYLVHYPELVLHFGPHIRLWTLRFESKHGYFKQCARKLHNFLNLCNTLAERHQLLQAYLHAGSFSPPLLQIGEATKFHDQLCQIAIQKAASLKGLCPEDTFETPSVTFKGTLYQRSIAIVINQNETGYNVGKVVLILINQACVHFMLSLFSQCMFWILVYTVYKTVVMLIMSV